MFNALTPVQLLGAIGQTLRMAAEASVFDGYQRSQLLSAHSVARLLASEQAAAAGLLEWTRAALVAALDGDARAAAREAAAALADARDGVEVIPTTEWVGNDVTVSYSVRLVAAQ